jgi:nicotinamide-nucleotide amidase
MKTSLLTIGDEICIGQIINTNAAWIAQKLSQIGIRVHAHSVVGDEISEIISETDRLLKLSDVIIITGGLGPTHDDRTKEALCLYLNDALELHPETLEYLKHYYQTRNRVFGKRQQSQALLPKKAFILQNNVGTAPGMAWILPNQKRIYSLPGVPAEMKFLMENQILPELSELQEKSGNFTLHKTLLTTGIAESDLADQIGDVSQFLESDSLAFLPSASGVRLRITVQRKTKKEALDRVSEIESILRQKASRWIFGEENETLAESLGKLLKSKKLTLSTAESCTGGMISSQITDISGSSEYFLGGVVAYSNELKTKILKVPQALIHEHGAVSKAVVEAMAIGACQEFQSDTSIAVSGISGPKGGSPDKPIGTTWIAVALRNPSNQTIQVESKLFQFGTNTRSLNRERAASAAIVMLIQKLTNL